MIRKPCYLLYTHFMVTQFKFLNSNPVNLAAQEVLGFQVSGEEAASNEQVALLKRFLVFPTNCVSVKERKLGCYNEETSYYSLYTHVMVT